MVSNIMVEDITINEEEEEKNLFPKVDRGQLYSILLIILIMTSVYISIIINKFWISVFIIVPVLSISKREEVSQAPVKFKQLALDSFWKLVRIILISAIVGVFLYLFVQIGIFITTILIFISFSLYNYTSTAIIRRNFEKNNQIKSEVF